MIGLMVFVTSMAAVVERAKERMRDALESTRAQAQAAHHEVQMVLDNVGQGFLIVDAHGVIGAARSAVIDRWFDAPRPGERLWNLFTQSDLRAAQWCAMSWDMLREDLLPREVVLDQLRSRLPER